MLSGHERQVLSSIEQHLLAEDPELCRTLRGGPDAMRHRRQLVTCRIVIAFGVLFFGFGIVLLNVGIVFFGGLVACAGWAGIRFVQGGKDLDDGSGSTW